MGYGKNLKAAIDRKGWTVSKVAKEAQINQQTLYTIIRRDSSVRFDYAVRLASVLGIDINSITANNPYDVEEYEPKLLNTHGELSDKINKKSYQKNRMGIELDLFDYKDQPILHELITKFYILDDEGRRQVIDSENLIAMRHTDKERESLLMEKNKSNKRTKK